jgi:DNA-directed RNA polymerase specialized sigma24 family protein
VALRHIEHLSNEETAHVLRIKPSAARTRPVRALKRPHEVLQRSPGFFDKNRE